MKGCGFCGGNFGMVEMNDDGKTYTVHLHEDEKEMSVKMDLKTLKDLGGAINVQLAIADSLKYEFTSGGYKSEIRNEPVLASNGEKAPG